MKRRIILLSVFVAALCGGGISGAQAIGENTTSAGGYWGCVGTHVVDFGMCVKNPLPERLPLPTVPSTPTV